MIAEGGHAALWLAAAFAALAAWRRQTELAPPLVIVAGLLALAAVLGLAWSGLAADFSLKIVDEHVYRLQTPAMRLAALSNSVPGILLLGAVSTGAAAAILIALGQPVARLAMALAVLLTLAVILDPFARQPVVPVEGLEMKWPPALLRQAVLVVAVGVLAAALARPLTRPPAWMIAAALGGAAASVAAVLLPPSMTAEAEAREGAVLRVGRLPATVTALRPVAGPGYTAIEARVTVDGAELRPRLWALPSGGVWAEPASARAGGGRVLAELTPGDRLRLTWRWL